MPGAGFVCVVDGGGSKTEAELLDPGGRCLARARSGACNLYRDPEQGVLALMDAWRQCCAAAGLDPAEAAGRTVLSAALAGTSAVSGRQRFYAATGGFARTALSSDAYAALLGAFEAGPGVLLSVGTGTVACRLDEAGRYQRLGGWGFPAGDRGGGAWIGLQAVAAWLERRDGVGPDAAADGTLWHAFDQCVGTERETILDWLRRAEPSEFAGLAPALLEAAGSPTACAILDEAAGHLAALARTLLRPGLELALAGGLAGALQPRLAARLGQACSLRPASALSGAWLIAVGRRPPEFAAQTEAA